MNPTSNNNPYSPESISGNSQEQPTTNNEGKIGEHSIVPEDTSLSSIPLTGVPTLGETFNNDEPLALHHITQDSSATGSSSLGKRNREEITSAETQKTQKTQETKVTRSRATSSSQVATSSSYESTNYESLLVKSNNITRQHPNLSDEVQAIIDSMGSHPDQKTLDNVEATLNELLPNQDNSSEMGLPTQNAPLD